MALDNITLRTCQVRIATSETGYSFFELAFNTAVRIAITHVLLCLGAVKWLRAEMLSGRSAWLVDWLVVRQVQLACVATVRISGRRLAEPCRLRGLYTAVVVPRAGFEPARA